VDQDFQLGLWVVRPTLNSVSRNGDNIRLEPKAMEVLACLAHADGKVVSKDKLIAEVWADTPFVGDDVLVRCISDLRRAMEDDAKAPHMIETIPKRGYRLLENVELIDSTPPPLPLPVITPADRFSGTTQTGSRRRWQSLQYLSAVIVILAIGVICASWAIRHKISLKATGTAAPIRSMAVLPLENLSGDPAQEYFADGMTDEVIIMLAKHLPLRVISRTSVMQYKNVHRPLPEIARELGVDGILEGSVGRSGNRVHLTAQLINAASDSHVWAESFDRDWSDVGALQNELAEAIAQQVGAKTSGLAGPERHINPEAHDAYLMGRYYLNEEQTEKSRGFFQKAIELQPDYAAAWGGIADSYLMPAVEFKSPSSAVMPQAETAARKALQLDDRSAEAHNSMAMIQLFYRWNWAVAGRESARAIELNPNLAESHFGRSYVLRSLNRLEEALQEEKKAMESDPLSEPAGLVYVLIRMRNFDAALSEARMRSDAQSNDADLHDVLSEAYFYKGMEKQSEAESERALQLAGKKNQLAEQIRAYRHGGMRGVLEWKVDRSKRMAAKRYVSPMDFADTYARLGRKEETIRYLEQSYQEREPHVVYLQSDPNFDFLHSDPRYRDIVNKMGLPPTYGP
jgi:TolB-like protein/DNA-binding winged helix-turn-helix (wHTH) protein/Tfp pilus assembly protein PilF